MDLYTTDGILLYSSNKKSLQETIEDAIQGGVILDGVDLQNKDLRNINLDNAIMRGACFRNTDLTGGNLSEAIMDRANFTHALLYNTCIAHSSLKQCLFTESQFGATDLSESVIDRCTFSGPTTFSLSFRNVKSMKHTKFMVDNKIYPMQKPPLHIKGGENEICIMDDHILIQNTIYHQRGLENYRSLPSIQNDYITLYNKLLTLSQKRKIS